jgi:two-component system cell cycle response regulator DivK
MQCPPMMDDARSKAAVPLGRQNGRGLKVLIADDHEDTRSLLRTVMELQHFLVLEASDGDEVVRMTESERPDLVLMDHSLPVIDGVTATELIRANNNTRDVLIVFLSGRAEPANQVAARAAGCNDYLIKPVNLDSLVESIERLLVSKKAPAHREQGA